MVVYIVTVGYVRKDGVETKMSEIKAYLMVDEHIFKIITIPHSYPDLVVPLAPYLEYPLKTKDELLKIKTYEMVFKLEITTDSKAIYTFVGVRE
jgi:hypothetical protein